jgi:2-polyprenyl-3-methyl-5-hydroxy-6-metoxy-1,4-benzoquinol methylase
MNTQLLAESASAPGTPEIRTRPCPDCILCGTTGKLLYAALVDRLFSAPGSWSLKLCQNPNCRLLWLDPMPLEADIGKAYETYFTHREPGAATSQQDLARRIWQSLKQAYLAEKFGLDGVVSKPFRRVLALPIRLSGVECDTLDIPLRYLAIPNKGRMLDVGCGDGSIVKLAKDLGWDAEGLDFDPQAVETARREGLSIRAGKLEEQSYPEGAFDFVHMSHVIEHVHNPLVVLREVRRVLRPGGLLVAMTPNADSWGHRHFGPDWAALDPPRHLHIFNADTLAALTKRTGFVRSTITTTLRITKFDFLESRLIRKAGRGDAMCSLTPTEALAGRAAAFAEMVVRIWKPLAADELLLEAHN